MVYPVRGFLKGFFTALVYIRKGLRIPVDQGKPAALNLDHNLMAHLKRMVHIRKNKLHFCDFTRHKRLRIFEAVPVLSPEDISTYKHLVASHFYFPGI